MYPILCHNTDLTGVYSNNKNYLNNKYSYKAENTDYISMETIYETRLHLQGYQLWYQITSPRIPIVIPDYISLDMIYDNRLHLHGYDLWYMSKIPDQSKPTGKNSDSTNIDKMWSHTGSK